MDKTITYKAEKRKLLTEREATCTEAEAAGVDMTAEQIARDDEIEARLTAIDKLIEVEERRKARAIEPAAEGAAFVGIEAGEDRRAAKPFASFGEQLVAIRKMALGEASADERQRLQMVAAAAGSGEALDSEGGFLVQTDYASPILARMRTSGAVFSRVNMKPLTGNSIEIPAIDETSRATGSRLGGITGHWVDEGNAPVVSKPTFYKLALKLKKVAALGYASDELLADAPLMSEIYTEGFADELLFLTEDAIIEGKGAGQPLGILNGGAVVSVAKESAQAAATFNVNNAAKMRARMPINSRRNAVWLYNQDIEPQLLTLVLSSGNVSIPVYMPAGGVSGQPFDTLYGMPMIPIEYASTLGTVGDIILADLSQYLLVSKGGIEQAQSLHVRFTTDEMTYRATYRCDGAPTWRSAVTPFKGSSTISPFVTLATRS